MDSTAAHTAEAVAWPFAPAMNFGLAWRDYMIDSWQRSVLFLDALRQRGNNYYEHNARQAPNVLSFEAELILDGRTLEQPVNYGLVRIVPPEGIVVDARKRPFVVFDPRAGHGPGIGGMKHDSEIGVALKAGHPCYFVGFLPQPVPGQTVADVCRAEARFVEEVVARHPRAEGKPCLIGNCQAGWQIMMMAALRPDLPGPIMLAGSPLSYWAGVRGKNPLRYLGGLLGGTWMTALAGDLGHGIFDGANLVVNFEEMNPANTLWQKPYTVYSKIDTEVPRFLEFEKWWGSPVLLNAQEMQQIADDLFVGNKLTAGQLLARDGTRVDLRNIKSPIIVFCSHGDDITPPQQALDWILDLYDDVRDIIRDGQTIVYSMHDTIGHLGIFVSGKVAQKEHGEFVQCMDMIDMMPPGLYEAVITAAEDGTDNPNLHLGAYHFRLEMRTLDDIRALGVNPPEDELRFETAARVSDINLGLYRTLMAPVVRTMSTEHGAEALRAVHPNRMRFSMFADRNPAMRPVADAADVIRANRQPASADNPFVVWEHQVSDYMIGWLKSWTQHRDDAVEQFFLTVYGNPLLQAAVGLAADTGSSGRREGRDLMRDAVAAHLAESLHSRMDQGGPVEAAVRALLYIRLPGGVADERGFLALREIGAELPPDQRVGLERFKEIAREQYLMLLHNEEHAIMTLKHLLPPGREERLKWLTAVRRVIAATGEPTPETRERLRRVERIFDVAPTAGERPKPGPRAALLGATSAANAAE